jgi:2-desacetyl-2-hydroxyethyl bacteriochlorophyllide A dehydrogenase
VKAAVFYGSGEVRLEELPKPKPGPEDVLIKVKAAGICGTDVHIIRGTARSAVPVVLGHEYSGEIVETGSRVAGLKVGDRITVDPNIACGECDYCTVGKVNLCRRLKALGVDLNGGFAEYSVLPAKQAYKLPSQVSYEEAALTEPLACCVHGIELVSGPRIRRAVILGGGPIGLMLVQLLRLEDSEEVILSEAVDKKRELALQLGAHRTVDPSRESMEPGGADLVIECAGLPQTTRDAFELVSDGGTILLFGLVDADVEVAIRPQAIVTRELRIQGSVLNPFTHEKALALIAERKVSVSPLVTHIFSLFEIESALKTYQELDAIKVLLTLSPSTVSGSGQSNC